MGTIAILIQAVLTADAKAAAIALVSEELAAQITLPDADFAKARLEATEEASMAIPAMEAFIGGLQTTYRNTMRERVVELGRVIIRLVKDGHAKAEDFDTEAQRAAVFEAIRFSMDALAPEVIPMLARLALEPVDHFFRGLVSIRVEQARELDQWLIPTWQETLEETAPGVLTLLHRNLGDHRAKVLMLPVATAVKLKRVVLGN